MVEALHEAPGHPPHAVRVSPLDQIEQAAVDRHRLPGVGQEHQLDARLLPQFDYVSLFHVGEFRTPDNDSYGALTDLEMTLIMADKLNPGGEVLFYTGSFAFDKAQGVAQELVKLRAFTPAPDYKTLKIFKKQA